MARVFAFFDFDDTLLDGDSILYWLRFYYNRRPGRRVFQLLNWVGLLLFLIRLVDSHTLKRIYLYPMSLENPEELDHLAEEFVRTDLAGRFHAPILRRLWTHHLLGHKIVIISASATFYLRHLKSLLPMADIQGSEMIWPKAPFLSLPRYRDGNLRGENKITRLKALGYADAAPLSFAYSDHQHDVFLLRFAEFPFCVRPTPKLRKIAAAEHWPIMDWQPEGGTDRPRWQVQLSKLRLLLFSMGPIGSTLCDPVHEAATAREYAPAHSRELSQWVTAKYPPEAHPEIHKTLFGAAPENRIPKQP